MPPSFLLRLKQWLMTADDTDTAYGASFNDIIAFLEGEITMRVYQILSGELPDFDLPDETVEGYKKVRKAMTNADRPSYKRPCPPNTVGHPADTLDPIIRKTVDDMNENNRNLYFLTGVTSTSMDDDKQPYSSPLFVKYGTKRTPTKEKKLKPVFHVAAATGSCQIIHICPDTIGLKLADMLSNMIQELIPNPEHRPLHAFVIDRGYLELAKEQNVRDMIYNSFPSIILFTNQHKH